MCWQIGIVKSLEFLNWKCSGRIECKRSELVPGKDGALFLPPDCPIEFGLTTASATAEKLIEMGWIRFNPKSKSYSFSVTNSNTTHSANIYFRTNGVDLHILPQRHLSLPPPLSELYFPRAEGRFVPHFLAQTKFNLYEWVVEFAQSFLANETNYDQYFNTVGSRDKASFKVKSRIHGNNPEEPDWRDGFRGTQDGDGNIYLSDGQYL